MDKDDHYFAIPFPAKISLKKFWNSGGRACPWQGLLCAAEGPVQEIHLPLRQARRGAARAVLVSLLEEGREDEEQVYGEGEAGEGVRDDNLICRLLMGPHIRHVR